MTLRRTALQLVLVIGIVLVIFPFAANLFSKTSAAEHLTDTFRPTFSNAGVAQATTDLNGVVAMADQLQTKTLPALPGALGMSNAQFQQLLTRNYPDVATGVAQLPTILPRLQTLVSGLGAEQSDYRKADAIPTGFLPITVVPYLVLVPGLVLALLAGIGLSRGKRKDLRLGSIALVASIIVGVVLSGAAVCLSLHGKGAAVDRLTAALGPYFTPEGADTTRRDMDTVQAMADQLQAKTLPDLATALHMSDAQFDAFLTTNFPQVAAGVAQLDTVLPRFQADVTAIGANADNFSKTGAIPFSWMPTSSVFWWFLLPGFALILIPVVAFLGNLGVGVPAPRAPRPVHA